MSMDKDLKIFIEDNIGLIENGYWELLYKKAAMEYLPHIGRITNLLLEAGINPLLNATRIPPFFFEYIEVEPLKKFNFKDIESIDEFAFSGCKSLSTIELPNIQVIERFAFNDCKDLKQVFLGASLESLKECIFEDCS